MRKLCTRDLTARLGNLRGGGNDVKKHPFFSDIDWDELEKKTHPVCTSHCYSWLVTDQIRDHLRPIWKILRMQATSNPTHRQKSVILTITLSPCTTGTRIILGISEFLDSTILRFQVRRSLNYLFAAFLVATSVGVL